MPYQNVRIKGCSKNTLRKFRYYPFRLHISKPFRTISSSQMEKLMLILEKEYSYIIFDTPPVNVLSDSLIGKILRWYTYGS